MGLMLSISPSVALSYIALFLSTSLVQAIVRFREASSTSTRILQGNECETDFERVHLAHAVSGGPYNTIDIGKRGKANIDLDGTASHSHSTSSGIGRIVRYRWTWFDVTNPIAQTNGMVSADGGKLTIELPVGERKLNLTVYDDSGNCARDETTVTVRPAISAGILCYAYHFGTQAPLHVLLPASIHELPRPELMMKLQDINFSGFDRLSFAHSSFALRCMFSIRNANESTQIFVTHDGPLKVYDGQELVKQKSGYGETATVIPARKYTSTIQVMYFKRARSFGVLKMTIKTGFPTSSKQLMYGSRWILPIITGLSKSVAFAEEIIIIYGSGFLRSVAVKFGDKQAAIVSLKTDSILVNVPKQEDLGTRKVKVTVVSSQGLSNTIWFTYATPTAPCHRPKFTTTTLFNNRSEPYKIADLTVVTTGPDGRFYLGSQRDMVYAIAIDRNLVVTRTCSKNVRGSGPRRWVMGMAFNPKSTLLNMYITTSTMFWAEEPQSMRFEEGWHNGKIQQLTLANRDACFDSTIRDIVVGLPVSNTDHGVNFLLFLPSGELLVSVASTTNGGVPGGLMGGVEESLLSGAILECPSTGYNEIQYSNLTHPSKASILRGSCRVYASGVRNSLGAVVHTNGIVYATDNGANPYFGPFALDCHGGQRSEEYKFDRLFQVERGSCYGHPNLPRGLTGDSRQCTFQSPECSAALLDNLDSSTNGIIEYRSNLFNGALKGSLFLSRYSNEKGKRGSVTRVELGEEGLVKPNGVTPQFANDSGLSIVEGPRGEMIMSRVYKDTFLVLKPQCDVIPNGTFLIAVHPKQGSASGGHRVQISGYNFGTSPQAIFGNTPCLQPESIDNDSFMCTTPPGVPNTQVVVSVQGVTGKSEHRGTDYWYWG